MTTPTGGRRSTAVLLLLFVGSGCAALVYEVVWFQLLRFAIGAGSVSLGILLASFMGGMLLGSFFFDRCVSTSRHPLRVYAGLELSVAVFGVLLPVLLPMVTSLYVSFAGYGFANAMVRGLVCALCLLPPAALMGATLPAVARFMERSRVGVARLGLIYGANTVGGVLGALLASFFLLRHYDVIVASAVAVALNVLVAVAALVLARLSPSPSGTLAARPATTGAPAPARAAPWIFAVTALSGLTALAAQVLWTRLLSLLMGATVYSFSLILAVFLIGIGLGGALGAGVARRVRDAPAALAACQLLLVGGIAWSAHAIPVWLPELYFSSDAAGWLVHRLDDLLRCGVATLPATLLWGASFPLALACVGPDRGDLGRTTGRVYAANTLGAILGALLASLVWIPELGTQASSRLLVALAALSALLAGASRLAPANEPWPVAGLAGARLARIAASALLVLALGAMAARLVPPLPEGLVTYGRNVQDWDVEHEHFAFAEGRNASVAVTREAGSGYRNLHVSGKVVASTWPRDMRLQRMLGHLPALVHPEPKSVLVVGFGAGVTSGVFALYPEVERITIVEIEPQVMEMAGPFFAPESYDVLNDPRTRVVLDDARHFLATTEERFDLVTSDPIHPWVKGAAALYTREYFDLVKQRLRPGGVVTQWVPFYETDERAVKSEIATFMEAFPNGTIWNTQEPGEGYDVILLGQAGPARLDVAALQGRLDANPRAQASLARVGVHSALELLSSFAGQREDLEGWLADAELNEDRSLRLEYLAGESLDEQVGDRIVQAMAGRLRYPSQLFVTSREQERSLRRSLRRNLR